MYGSLETRDSVFNKLPYDVRMNAPMESLTVSPAPSRSVPTTVIGGRAGLSATALQAIRSVVTAASAAAAANQYVASQLAVNQAAQARGYGSYHQTPAQMEAIRKQQEALRKAQELQSMLSTLEKVSDEGRRSSLLDTLCSNGDILALPVHPDPPGTKSGDLTVDLLKHQVCCLIAFRLAQGTDLCTVASPTMVY